MQTTTIGKNIQRFRKKKKLTQKRLAEITGLATGTIQQYELDKRQPNMKILHKIADTLDVTVSDLIWQGEGKAPEPGKYIDTPPYGSRVRTEKDELNLFFDELNGIGQTEAVKRVKELTFIDEYVKKEK
ncbi:helix-turn-helix transcriptional regulator [Aminipila butyrica]|uniref:Helix-turn-helix transcriptional regulator n=1 Tax=Aminipila butyrica TaxID=433296 RepID=A0A858BR64_9FIRM|nr:helix-turn-helix transcriptional regulator [Aminipila butyrica]QIB67822.1 helix-turn-helix transcriptional regulator [Aminipila butyrica]